MEKKWRGEKCFELFLNYNQTIPANTSAKHKSPPLVQTFGLIITSNESVKGAALFIVFAEVYYKVLNTSKCTRWDENWSYFPL